MSSKREKNMDELLKAYAKKRRADAAPPLEVPPGTRQALQSEIARVFDKPERSPSRFNLWASFWRRFALAGTAVAMLIAAGSLWLRKDESHKLELAKNASRDALSTAKPDAAPRMQQATESIAPVLADDSSLVVKKTEVAARPQEPTPVKRPTTAPSEGLGRDLEVAKADAVTSALSASRPVQQGNALSASAPASVERASTQADSKSPPSSGPPVASDKPAQPGKTEISLASTTVSNPEAGKEKLRSETAVMLARDENAKSGPAAMPQLPTADSNRFSTQSVSNSAANFAMDGQGNGSRLYFSQAESRSRYRRNFNSPPVPNILPTFEVQREGGNVRVVDADGSVYEGSVQAVAPELLPAQVQPGRVGQQVEREQVGLRGAVTPAENRAQAMSNQNGNAEAETFFFRVAGTNRSLNQRVVITGNYEAAANALLPGGSGGFGGGAAVANGGASPALSRSRMNVTSSNQALSSFANATAPAPVAGAFSNAVALQAAQNQMSVLPNGRIAGKAVVGGTNEFNIHAHRIQP
jgi:hypothetical protein